MSPPRRVQIALAAVHLALAVDQQRAAGADVPWVTYEAERMTRIGDASTIGPSYTLFTAAAECSGRAGVSLAQGAGVSFTAGHPANTIVLRYSLPDGIDGRVAVSVRYGGAAGTWVPAAELALTSRLSWRYGAYPFTNNAADGSPRGAFDEARGFLSASVAAGDLVRLELLDATGTGVAGRAVFDLVDLEQAPPPLPIPDGAINAASCGVRADADVDQAPALEACLQTHRGNVVYLPPGSYHMQSDVVLPGDTALLGAGMWHTAIVGGADVYADPARRVRLLGAGDYIRLADFAITGALNYRDDGEANDGVAGAFGVGSAIERLWIEHTKTGFWVRDSSHLVIDSCRVRNTIADGVNLCSGVADSTVTNGHHRGNGDDAFAMWPADPGRYAHRNNRVVASTGVLGWLAQGAAVYGGANQTVADCVFEDAVYATGVLVSTTFPVGEAWGGGVVVADTTIARCGGTRGGLELFPDRTDIAGVDIRRVNITASARHGIHIASPHALTLTDTRITDVVVTDSGRAGIGDWYDFFVEGNVHGTAVISNSTVAKLKNTSPDFKLAWNT